MGKVKQIDNRGSNFYVALYWAEELAAKDPAWAPLAQALKDNEAAIQQELIDIKGVPADVGGYYKLDEDKANAVMRPSKIQRADGQLLGPRLNHPQPNPQSKPGALRPRASDKKTPEDAEGHHVSLNPQLLQHFEV